MNHWTLLIALIVGYVAILSIATVLVQPVRVRLVQMIDDMLGEGRWNKSERSMLDFLADSCISSSAGLLLPFAAAYTLASSIVTGGNDDDCSDMEALENDPRHIKLIALYLVSVAGGSPFAAALALPLIVLTVAVRVLRGSNSINDAFDAPIRQVSASFKHC